MNECDIDRENAFLLYATFCGDVERTAHALNVPAVAILKMADEEGWSSKLGPILALKKSTRPGDIERAINRALNFVQAHRMRLFVARVIHRLTGMDTGEFESYIFSKTVSKEGTESMKLSTRAIADLAVAMEKAQAMSYQALSDTAQDRAKRKESEGDSEVSAGDLHARIAEGIAAVKASASPRAQLFDAQLEQAQRIVQESRKPVSPHDDDDH